jgi:hypothetical protein
VPARPGHDARLTTIHPHSAPVLRRALTPRSPSSLRYAVARGVTRVGHDRLCVVVPSSLRYAEARRKRVLEPCFDDPFPDNDTEPVMMYANG